MLEYEEQANHFKSLDMFGYSVRWNIDKDNNTHKTFLGAFVTLFYALLVAVVFFFMCEHSLKDLISD